MRFTDLLLALILAMLWGFNFIVIKLGLQDLPPIFLCCVRFFLTSLPAVFFVPRPKVALSKICLYGMVMFALQFTLLFSGMHAGVTAALASILLQCHVFFTIFLAFFFLKEAVQLRQIVGALISFSGVCLVAMNRDQHFTLLGLGLLLGAAATWGLGSIIVKKIGKVDPLPFVIWSGLIAWPPLLLLSLYWEGSEKILASLHNASWSTLGTIAYITYPTTLFCFAMWNRLIHDYPLATIAPFTFLVPLFGMTGASLVLNEPIQPWKIIAALLIVTGLTINLLGERLFRVIRSTEANEQ